MRCFDVIILLLFCKNHETCEIIPSPCAQQSFNVWLNKFFKTFALYKYDCALNYGVHLEIFLDFEIWVGYDVCMHLFEF
jgi:hypothetical protein